MINTDNSTFMYSVREMDGIGEGIAIDGVKVPTNHYMNPSPIDSTQPQSFKDGIITWTGGFYTDDEDEE